MALVDTLELLPKTPKYAAALYSIRLLFRDLAASLLRAVDSRSGAWWQILDQPGREGNYIESSGSAMFIYSLLKGTRLGFLPEMDVNRVARRAYEYIVDRFVFENENGTLGYNGTVAVCSLNSTATYEVGMRAAEDISLHDPL
jgi:rhamnogalacturonyl hydrolase YesR